MSRERFVHPKIWNSDDFCALSVFSRLLFLGLFTTSDDAGRRKASPRSVKGDVLPQDADLRLLPPGISEGEPLLAIIAAALDEINEHGKGLGLSRLYSVEGEEFLDHPNWAKYQNPRYTRKSHIPARPSEYVFRKHGSEPAQIAGNLGNSPQGRGGEGWGGVGEGKGREGLGGIGREGEAEPEGGSPEPRREIDLDFKSLEEIARKKNAREAIEKMKKSVEREEGKKR